MSEKVNAGAAPVSKYAAKRAARVNTTVENVNTENSSNVEKEAVTQEYEGRKPFKSKGKDGIPSVAVNYPEHIVQIALLIKNNAEIRRFTSLGILNYLLQKGEITGEKRYVSFKWNKFAVKSNGLMREYTYNEPFFLNALVAAFTSFSASAQRTIDTFCKKEMSISISKAVDAEEVNNIAALNEEYQNAKNEVEDE